MQTKERNMPKKIPKALDKEVYDICEYADDRCLVCQMPIEIIKEIHKLRFEDGLVLRDIAKFLHAKGYKKIWPTLVDTHFTKHCRGPVFDKLVPYNSNVNPKLSKVVYDTLNDRPETSVVTQAEIESAYSQLTRLVAQFTANLPEIQTIINKRFENKEQVERELQKIPIMALLDQFAVLQKQCREQVRDITQLRAPKVIVVNMLESAINEIIRDVSDLLKDSLGEIQMTVLEDSFMKKDLNQTFPKLFQKIVTSYKQRMLSIRRETMARASASLQEMQNIL
jgi:hypothetical protein